jgi:hypothetical protein
MLNFDKLSRRVRDSTNDTKFKLILHLIKYVLFIEIRFKHVFYASQQRMIFIRIFSKFTYFLF